MQKIIRKKLFILLFSTLYFSSTLYAQDISTTNNKNVSKITYENKNKINTDNYCNGNHYTPYFWWSYLIALATPIAALLAISSVVAAGAASYWLFLVLYSKIHCFRSLVLYIKLRLGIIKW